MLPWQLTLFQSPPVCFQYFSHFQLTKIKPGQDIYQTYLYVCQIMLMRHHWQVSKWEAKIDHKSFLHQGVWNPVCCHGNKIVYGTQLEEHYYKESNISDVNWLR